MTLQRSIRPDLPAKLAGTIRTLMADKGFGFIHGHDEREYFFHRSECPDFQDLEIGTAVRFEPTEGAKGPRAEKVEVV
jgi:cold shock CspA family protein